MRKKRLGMGLKARRHGMRMRDAEGGIRRMDPGRLCGDRSAEVHGAAGPDVRAGGEGGGALPPGFAIRGGAVWQTWESGPKGRGKDDGMNRRLGRRCPPGLRGGVFDGPELDDVVRFCG